MMETMLETTNDHSKKAENVANNVDDIDGSNPSTSTVPAEEIAKLRKIIEDALGGELNEYELARLFRIVRNQKHLVSLGLASEKEAQNEIFIRMGIAAEYRHKKTGQTTKKRKKTTVTTTDATRVRRSTRLAALPLPDHSLDLPPDNVPLEDGDDDNDDDDNDNEEPRLKKALLHPTKYNTRLSTEELAKIKQVRSFAWFKGMEKFLATKRGPKNKADSPTNIQRTLSKVELLAAGLPIRCTTWKEGIVFCPGPVNLDWDLEELAQQADEYVANYGPDLGNGTSS